MHPHTHYYCSKVGNERQRITAKALQAKQKSIKPREDPVLYVQHSKFGLPQVMNPSCAYFAGGELEHL